MNVRSLLTFHKKRLVGILFLFPLIVHAAAVEVSSQLSNEETRVGVPVRLEVVVQGARNAQVPRGIGVDGLQVHYVGESVQVQIVNFQVSASASYAFNIMPLRSGDFTIPELAVNVNGYTFRTKPLNLRVYGSRTQSGTPPPAGSLSKALPPSEGGQEKLAFGILLLPKKKIYVGEVVPVEIRYYFHPDLPLRSVESIPSLIGDDFVVHKIPAPQEGQQEIHGVRYTVITFRSSIRPLKTGELQLPGTSMTCRILTQARPEIPPGIADSFFQQFLSSMPGVARLQRMDVKSDPVTIQVIPLPEQNRPESFHGAIGKFALHTEVSPHDPSPGDPVTVRATIAGEGNFDQMEAPDLTSKQGWQSYPPSSKFIDSDQIGYEGKRVFEWILVPQEKKTVTPDVEFSYFNPTISKYVTLHTRGLPVQAEPAVNPAPMLTAVAAAASPSPPVAKGPKFGIAAIQTQSSFQPILARHELIIANAAALLGFLAFLGIQLAKRYAAAGGAERAALRRSLAACWVKLSASQEGKPFYSAAVDFLYLWAHLRTGQDTKGYSSEQIVNAIGFQQEEAALVQQVFAHYDEMTYGAESTEQAVSSEIRTAILKLLKRGK